MTDTANATRTAQTHYDTEVAIVGAGPVGTLLAILLGRTGKKVTLIERWSKAYDRPRAVTFDHEIARILATLGIDSENDSAITWHDELYYWKSTSGEDIQIVDWQSQSASGWRVRYWFNQPDLEARLMRLAEACPSVTHIRGFDATALVQDDESATLTLQRNRVEAPNSDEEQTLRAKFVVGSDGANSTVRDVLGIENEDRGYFFDWLILDMIPKGEFEMSPAQWQLCDPRRPTTIVPGGPGRRRWEFMVLPHENVEEISSEENAWRLMEPWGVTPENADLERSAVYRFQARWAKTWNVGRCMIAGDAAHLMPPFAGEGMCAGLRDAFALGWRLNAILDGTMGADVLDSYTTERIEHARHYIEFSQDLGNIICISDPEAAAKRDAEMRKELVARDFKPVPTDVCQLGKGAWCADSAHAGELSAQGIVNAKGLHDRFDQAVGHGWIVIGLDADPTEALTAQQSAQLGLLGGRTVRIAPAGTNGDVIDAEGTYARWFEGLGAKYALLRPDFYVAATAATPEDLRRYFDMVMVRIYLRSDALLTTA